MIFRFDHFKENKISSQHNILKDELYISMRLDFIERVKLLKINFNKILILDCYDKIFVTQLKKEIIFNVIIEQDSNLLDLITERDFDLVISYFSMHVINNLHKFLINIHKLLSSTGILLAKTTGEKNLENLYKLFIRLEMKYNEPHYMHIIPSIKREMLVQVLQNIGYHNIVVDYDKINITTSSPLEFIKKLKSLGDKNILKQKQHNMISKNIYNQLSMPHGFHENIYILNLICSKNNKMLLEHGYAIYKENNNS